MAYWKLGRNPNHPGDPPPKWASPSRSGCFALVVGVVAGVIIALAIIATRPANAASDHPQAASRGVSGQRIEMPWAGVAVTYPDDWHVLTTPEELPRTREGRLMGPAIPIFPVLATGVSPQYQQRLEQCDLGTLDLVPRWQPLPLTTSDVAYSLAILALPDGDFGTTELTLPAGGATRLTQRTRAGDRFLFHSVFVIARDPGYVWLWCTSLDESPADDWLAIAESIEFLLEEK